VDPSFQGRLESVQRKAEILAQGELEISLLIVTLPSGSKFALEGGVWKNTATKVEATAAERAAIRAAPVKTQWGWTNSNSWRAAAKEVGSAGEGGILRSVGGKVPTYEEGARLIEEAGGKIVRVEGPHPPGGVAGNIDFPHINYTTAGGTKGHLQIQQLPTN
jgi:hypothetical protein